jgi:transglutaminase-like putative cysteine protease
MPPTLPTQRVLSHTLTIDPDVRTSSYTDHHGNHVEFFSLPFRHDRLVVTNHLIVQTQPPEHPAQSLNTSIQEVRQILNSALADYFEYTQPTAVIDITRESVQWAKKYLRGSLPIGAALEALNRAIHSEFKYLPGSTENTTPLAKIWKQKAGVCQDFAHVGLSIIRAAGLPARYVCGYIDSDPGSQRLTGNVATHAWIEVLVPGLKWVALDPTNRQWANEHYVTVSVAPDYRDCAPLRGTFKGSSGQQMKVRVTMKHRNGKARR